MRRTKSCGGREKKITVIGAALYRETNGCIGGKHPSSAVKDAPGQESVPSSSKGVVSMKLWRGGKRKKNEKDVSIQAHSLTGQRERGGVGFGSGEKGKTRAISRPPIFSAGENEKDQLRRIRRSRKREKKPLHPAEGRGFYPPGKSSEGNF